MSLSKRDVHHFHRMFYSTPKKILQDHFIVKYCQIAPPKRCRKKLEHSSKKGMSISYFVKKATLKPGAPANVQVCQKTFMKILNIKKTRIQNVCRKHMQGRFIKDNRGGDTRSKKYTTNREAIGKFMGQIQVIEKHYCRSKSQRQYLVSDLNINKLWRLYNSSCENNGNVTLQVKKSFFRNHINMNYNIGFGAPAVDACSRCLRFKEQLKHATTAIEKQNLMSQKRIHSLQAKAFFQMLGQNTTEDTLVLSYDCQKNQVLPKVPDQRAYYSRQLYMYNFTVVEGSSQEKLGKENVFSYTWCEHEHPKGSNEIASAVFHALNTRAISPSIKTVRLFADGCGGQNKNSIIIGMVSKWLLDHAPANVYKVELIFPVPGHSFMPSDRVFAFFEKEIRKKDTIISPLEYRDIYSNYSTVFKLGSDCPNFNWKEAVSEVLKPPGKWHFQFNASKRFIICRNKRRTNTLVRGEVFYRSDVNNPKSVTQKNKVISDIHPVPIHKRNAVKPAKLKDVDNLLKSHYGEDWKNLNELSLYVEVLNNPPADDIEPDEQCEHQEDCFENNELRV